MTPYMQEDSNKDEEEDQVKIGVSLKKEESKDDPKRAFIFKR